VSRAALGFVVRQVIARNRVIDGMVYVQVTRGVAPRDHGFPPASTKPTLVVDAHSLDRGKIEARANAGIRVVTVPDLRWKRPEIKSISLLPNVLARQAAREAGAQEAWLLDEEGFVTEGAASNAWIVTPTGALVTRQADRSILRGVTRTTLIDIIAELGLRLEERPFSIAEARQSAEAFLTGATTHVMPIIAIDNVKVGDGNVGPVALKLRARLIK
jgi:D-alanine transaminase